MNDDYNQPQNNFIKNSYRSCHSLMVLEEGRDILWLMIGRDNWWLLARPSIMSRAPAGSKQQNQQSLVHV